MSLSVYSIIWADDECVALEKDKSIRRLLDLKHIEVLSFVRTSQELKDKLEFFNDKVDAVVVDGNFSKEVVAYVDPHDITGLIHTTSFIELFNRKRDIPFFLYTAKKVMLEQLCKNGEIEYFTGNQRLFQKGNIEALFDEITQTVEHIHSREFLVKKNHGALFSLASRVNQECADHLYQFLLDEARDTKCDKGVEMFNSLRKMMEQVHSKCIEGHIIPEYLSELNQFKHFWGKKGWMKTEENIRSIVKPIENLMPPALAKSIGALIDILQDGSHKKENLNLHVSEYVFKAQSPFLFRSCLYQVMDIIKWLVITIESIEKGEMPQRLYTEDTEEVRPRSYKNTERNSTRH